MIDFTKPVQTRDGRPVRILCTDSANPGYPVAGLIENRYAYFWTLGGCYCHAVGDRPKDLVQAPAITTKWRNVYLEPGGPQWDWGTRAEAERCRNPDLTCIGWQCMTFEDGKFKSATFEPV